MTPLRAAFFSALAIVLASSTAQAKILLDIDYTVASVTAVGETNIRGGLRFVLNGKDVTVYDTTGGAMTRVGSRSSGRGYLFGPADFKVGMHSNSVDLYAIYISHVTHTHVTTNGSSSCHAAVTLTLKPGYAYFHSEVPGVGPIDVYRAHVYDVSCRLSTN